MFYNLRVKQSSASHCLKGHRANEHQTEKQKRTRRRRLARSHVERFFLLERDVCSIASLPMHRSSFHDCLADGESTTEARLFIDSWIERKPAGKLRFPGTDKKNCKSTVFILPVNIFFITLGTVLVPE